MPPAFVRRCPKSADEAQEWNSHQRRSFLRANRCLSALGPAPKSIDLGGAGRYGHRLAMHGRSSTITASPAPSEDHDNPLRVVGGDHGGKQAAWTLPSSWARL
jgi:hypothetical protein